MVQEAGGDGRKKKITRVAGRERKRNRKKRRGEAPALKVHACGCGYGFVPLFSTNKRRVCRQRRTVTATKGRTITKTTTSPPPPPPPFKKDV